MGARLFDNRCNMDEADRLDRAAERAHDAARRADCSLACARAREKRARRWHMGAVVRHMNDIGVGGRVHIASCPARAAELRADELRQAADDAALRCT
jgi:hypothetical protein